MQSLQPASHPPRHGTSYDVERGFCQVRRPLSGFRRQYNIRTRQMLIAGVKLIFGNANNELCLLNAAGTGQVITLKPGHVLWLDKVCPYTSILQQEALPVAL